MTTRRTAGIALLVYALATFVANSLIGAPGGMYEPKVVTDFVSSDHYAVAFALAYVGCLGALALLPFVLGMRAELGRGAELAWGLGIAAAATGVIGWFITGGVDVAMAEGGSSVAAGVTHPTVYTLTEIGNLVSWCAPALFIGIVAILLSRSTSLPRWLRIFSVVAGVCGILAPFFFTFFVYLLWTLVLGVTLISRRTPSTPEVQPSLV
jgi:hypothetical protein